MQAKTQVKQNKPAVLIVDDEAGIRLGTGGRQDQIAVRGRISTRLAKHSLSQIVGLRLQVDHLLKHGFAGNIEHAADNNAARFPATMEVDGVDHVRNLHCESLSFSINRHPSTTLWRAWLPF